MKKKPMSKELLNMVASRFKVLSEPIRLEILQTLMQGEKNVSQIVKAVGSSQPNVSKHLQDLLQRQFIDKRKEGVMVYYRIADPKIYTLCDLMCGCIQDQIKKQTKGVRL